MTKPPFPAYQEAAERSGIPVKIIEHIAMHEHRVAPIYIDVAACRHIWGGYYAGQREARKIIHDALFEFLTDTQEYTDCLALCESCWTHHQGHGAVSGLSVRTVGYDWDEFRDEWDNEDYTNG